MKIMGRVARLILLIVMFVCVVFCVLCCLQNNPVFSSVTYLNIKKWKLWAMYFDGFLHYGRKKKSSSHLSGEKKKIQSSMYFNGFLHYGRRNKKFQSSIWRKTKDTVVYVFQRVSLLRPEKKSSSRLSGEKQKIQSSVCWVRGSGGKKKIQSSVQFVLV